MSLGYVVERGGDRKIVLVIPCAVWIAAFERGRIILMDLKCQGSGREITLFALLAVVAG